MRKVLLTASILACALPGCVPFVGGSQPPVTQSAACSSLLPDEWKKPVSAPPVPDGEVVGDYVAFADATLARLDMVNDRLLSALGIVGRCEERDAAARKAAARGFIGRLIH